MLIVFHYDGGSAGRWRSAPRFDVVAWHMWRPADASVAQHVVYRVIHAQRERRKEHKRSGVEVAERSAARKTTMTAQRVQRRAQSGDMHAVAQSDNLSVQRELRCADAGDGEPGVVAELHVLVSNFVVRHECRVVLEHHARGPSVRARLVLVRDNSV